MPDLESLAAPGAAPITGGIVAPSPTASGLTLGHVLTTLGAEHSPGTSLDDILVMRHTFRPGNPEALQGLEDITEERVLAYTAEQKFDSAPHVRSEPELTATSRPGPGFW